MRVRVRLFAAYREIVGRGDVRWTGNAGTTVDALVEDLIRRHPRLAGHRDSMILAVNHEFAPPDAVLRDGDEVAIMPPVSGGRP